MFPTFPEKVLFFLQLFSRLQNLRKLCMPPAQTPALVGGRTVSCWVTISAILKRLTQKRPNQRPHSCRHAYHIGEQPHDGAVFVRNEVCLKKCKCGGLGATKARDSRLPYEREQTFSLRKSDRQCLCDALTRCTLHHPLTNHL